MGKCRATREAVQEQNGECPVCGCPPWLHDLEMVARAADEDLARKTVPHGIEWFTGEKGTEDE